MLVLMSTLLLLLQACFCIQQSTSMLMAWQFDQLVCWHLQAIEKNAEPVVRDLAHQILKPAAAAAASADPAAKQFSEEGIMPAAKIVADNVQPVAKGFTDQTLLPTAQKVSIWHMLEGFTYYVLVAKVETNAALTVVCTGANAAARHGVSLSLSSSSPVHAIFITVPEFYL